MWVCRIHDVSILCTGTLCHRCRSDPTVPTCDMWSGPSLHQQRFVTSIIVHQQSAINFFINFYPAQAVLLPISIGLKMAYCSERIAIYVLYIYAFLHNVCPHVGGKSLRTAPTFETVVNHVWKNNECQPSEDNTTDKLNTIY